MPKRLLRIISGGETKSYSDRREAPRYKADEVAKWLRLPQSTIWAWFFGQPNFKPLLVPADNRTKLLSFYNLTEAHVLSWTRQKYPNLRTVRIRTALEYVRENLTQYERPLVTKKFRTDGKYLFIKSLSENGDEPNPTINASRWGQLALPVLDELLELIEYDDQELARLLYPQRGGKVIVINPSLSSGQPVVKGTSVLASIIWQRVRRAGEPIERLARDYRLDQSEIQAAINYIEAA
jgi:uncharacterized protein (DUF433 family)